MTDTELRAQLSPAARRFYDLGREDGYVVAQVRLMEFQGARCALCPVGEDLVLDHDHDTGLIRGYLCRGCNTSEGAGNQHPIFVEYRRRPPAAVLGIQERYIDPLTQRPALTNRELRVALGGTADPPVNPFLGKNAAVEAGL